MSESAWMRVLGRRSLSRLAPDRVSGGRPSQSRTPPINPTRSCLPAPMPFRTAYMRLPVLHVHAHTRELLRELRICRD